MAGSHQRNSKEVRAEQKLEEVKTTHVNEERGGYKGPEVGRTLGFW